MASSVVKQQLSSIPVPIAEGGTGAKTKANAQTNLGIHEKIYDADGTLLNSGYVSTEATYTATADGFFYAVQAAKNSTSTATIKVNGNNIRCYDNSSGAGEDYGIRVTIGAGFLKKGDTITYNNTTIRICKLR